MKVTALLRKIFCIIFLFVSYSSLFASDFAQIESVFVEKQIPSLHVLIATTGRESVLRMLNSLEDQLQERDYLTVVFDAKDNEGVFDKVYARLAAFQCICNVIMEEKNLGYWGHGIRNKHNQLPGDFILHADDDDSYLPGAFEEIRKFVSQDLNALYIFQFENNKRIVPGQPFRQGNVGTPSGVVPAGFNAQSNWGYYYGGDFEFYCILNQKVPRTIFINKVIYQVGK